MDGDWTPFREVLDKWAKKAKPLKLPDGPEETRNCCMRQDPDTVKALEKEAKRLTKVSGRKWTAGKVAREIYDRDA